MPDLKPCEETFERLAHDDPAALIPMIIDGFGSHHLTFVAECPGYAPCELALDILKELLTRDVPHVRGGAVYGLAHYLPDEEIESILRYRYANEPDRNVRDVINSYLED